MNIPSLMLSQDLASLLITLTGQSIIVSLIGIAVIKLLSGQSAPVRSLVCAATIAALGLLMVISIGFRLSDIAQDQTHPPILLEENTSNQIASSESGKALPFASVHLPPRIQSQFSNEKGMVQSISSLSPLSIQLTPTESLIINIMGFIWLTGIMLQMVRLSYSVVLSEKFRNNLLSVKDTAFNSMVRNVASTFWNNRMPELYSSPLVESPITIGIFNPIIIIPERLLATLSENELKSILLHELSHIYHYDQVISVIKRLVLAFYWWNPFVYEIDKYHEQAREEVSDNYVLRELHPKVYTRCLLDLAEKVSLISGYPTAVGMAGRRFDLRVRVEQLLSKKRRVTMNTRSYLKVITFSISLVLTFMVAGLYASVKVEAIDDAGKELQETRDAINPASIFGEDQHLAQKNATEPEAIEEQALDNSQKISKTETATQAKSSKKQIQATVDSIGTLASTGTNAKENIEKQDETEVNSKLSHKEAIVNNAQAADAYISRGVSNFKKGQIDDAISDINKAIELNPEDAAAYFNRGNAFYEKGQIEKAVSDYTKAIEKNPRYTNAYFSRGYVYLTTGEYSKAISDYNTVIDIHPDNAHAYNYRGCGYFAQEEYQEAIDDFSKAIALDPGYIDAYRNRGYIYYDIKKMYRSAIEDYSKAIELNPEDAVNYYYRGNAYLGVKFYNDGNNPMQVHPFAIKNAYRALSDFDMAIKLNPRYDDAYVRKGYIYYRIGNFSKAIKINEKALDLNPDNAIAKRLRLNYFERRQDEELHLTSYPPDYGEIAREGAREKMDRVARDAIVRDNLQ
jgi:tetratricopeptide (TPR) repeat protein/beta-lactamase regulating signal transducer with metallopeptidase domain